MKTKQAKLHVPEVPTSDNLKDVILQLKYRGDVNTGMVKAAVQEFVMNRDSFELANVRDFLRAQFGKRITRVKAGE